MFVKIDTRSDFRIIKLIEPFIYANMADDFYNAVLEKMNSHPYHLILDVEEVQDMEFPVPDTIAKIQSMTLEKGYSFYISGSGDKVADKMKDVHDFDKTHSVSTLAEAIDMVMMEKIERELLEGNELH